MFFDIKVEREFKIKLIYRIIFQIFINRLKKNTIMKQITATIPSGRLAAVSDAINDIVGGFTAIEGRGRGSSKRQIVRQGRGTGSTVAEYNQTTTVFTIVPDEDVEKVSNAITSAANSGSRGDGIIIVTNIDSVNNISTKKSGEEAL